MIPQGPFHPFFRVEPLMSRRQTHTSRPLPSALPPPPPTSTQPRPILFKRIVGRSHERPSHLSRQRPRRQKVRVGRRSPELRRESETSFRCLGWSRVSPLSPPGPLARGGRGRGRHGGWVGRKRRWAGRKKEKGGEVSGRGRRESSRLPCAKGDGVVVIDRQTCFR